MTTKDCTPLMNQPKNAIITPQIADELQKYVEMVKRNAYLEAHKYKIYQGKDGRWFTRVPEVTGGSVQKAFRSRRELENFLISYYESLKPNPTIAKLFSDYELERLNKGRITSGTWQRNRMAFKALLSDLGDRRILDVTPSDICEEIERVTFTNGLNLTNYKRLKGLVRIFIKAAVKMRLITYSYETINSMLEIGARDLSESTRDDSSEVYDVEDCKKLKLYLMDSDMPHDLALLLFLFTGLRNGEMTVLRWSDYDGTSLRINRMERLEYDTNGSKHFSIKEGLAKTATSRRFVPLTDGAKAVLKKMRRINPGGNYIFEDETGRRITSENLRKRLAIVCRNLGIRYRPPHKLRKTFITILLDNNVSPTIVQDIAGHKSPATTLQYYKMRRTSAEQIAKKYYANVEELRIE